MTISGCHSGQEASGDKQEAATIVLNGTVPELSAEENSALVLKVRELMAGCDDFYELIVTNELIKTLKETEKYLDIRLPRAEVVSTEKYGELDVTRIFIPLSGRYAGQDQITFFSWSGDYPNTPLVRTEGLDALLKELGL